MRGLLRRFWSAWRDVRSTVASVFSVRSVGRALTAERALKYTTVWACVSLKAETWASLPVQHLRRQMHNDVPVLQEVVRPTPLLEDPTGDGFTTWPELISGVSLSLDLWGNAFLEVVVRNGRPFVDVLDPCALTVQESEQPGQEYAWLVAMRHGEPVVAPRWKPGRAWGVLHIPHLRQPGHVLGMAPLAAAAEAISVGQEAEAFAGRFFANSARPDIMVEFPPNTDVDDGAVKRLAAGWAQRHEGAERAHKVGILTDGAKLHTLSIAPEQAQFLQSRVHQAEDVARAFGVPQHAVGLLSKSTSWGSGIEEQSIGYMRFGEAGRIRRTDARLSMLLPRGHVLRTRISEVEQASWSKRVEGLAKLRSAGVVSANDVRDALGWRLLDDPDADAISAPAQNPVAQEAAPPQEVPVAPGQEPEDVTV